MTTILKITRFGEGAFHLDEENRKIEKIEILNADALETNFPGATKEDFTYDKLELIMKLYTKLSKHHTMSDVIDKIIEKGFFYPLRPALRIEAERLFSRKDGKAELFMSVIGFGFKPSVAYLNIYNMELSWIQSMDKDHEIFRQLSNVEEFDYSFINDILVIPDPVPVGREEWNRKVGINGLEIECRGNFLVFFNFKSVKEGVILADSLTLPQFELLKSSIRLM